MIGTTAALIMAGLSAAGSTGVQAYGAHQAGNASKQAAQQQQQATRDAQAYAERMFGMQQQMLAPQIALGNSAFSTLGRLTAPPAGARFAAPPLPQPAMYNPATFGMPAPFSSAMNVNRSVPSYIIQ